MQALLLRKYPLLLLPLVSRCLFWSLVGMLHTHTVRASVAAVVHIVVLTGKQRADSSISCKVLFVLLTSDCSFSVSAINNLFGCFGTRDFLSVSDNVY